MAYLWGMTIEYATNPDHHDPDHAGSDMPGPGMPGSERGSYLRSLRRGLGKRCPKCGEGRMFRSYLKVVTVCEHCGEELGDIRADDFPPYLTMFIVGHIVVPLILISEKIWQPDTWVHMAVWPVVSLVLILAMLSPVKAGCVATLWHLRLRGDEFQ